MGGTQSQSQSKSQTQSKSQSQSQSKLQSQSQPSSIQKRSKLPVKRKKKTATVGGVNLSGGTNRVSSINELPVHQRGDAVSSLVYEANARMRDPVYGCVGTISYLQNQVSQLQMQLAVAQAEILCIQMQHDPPAPSPLDHPDENYEKALFSSANSGFSDINSLQHYLSFASTSSANNVVMQDPLKREYSLWT
ncbi:LOB domain-containing protein 12 [Striga hermonthica]|uniref:LOB domain-containing protein 12 n=1 Tax=Striga hermonthica TaxID=68872 RepID=A0A9N7NT47_STRHE|nr:LOB domain-containing protein 12 [Striga hermonthica]